MRYKLYPRVSANIGVYTKGNEQRMGKGKGKFDYWATRLPVNRIVFELKGDLHEQVAREAFRLAGHKLPGALLLSFLFTWCGQWLTVSVLGLWEFVKKGDPPVVGLTKLGNGVTLESLKRARRSPPLGADALSAPPKSTSSSPSASQ